MNTAAALIVAVSPQARKALRTLAVKGTDSVLEMGEKAQSMVVDFRHKTEAFVSNSNAMDTDHFNMSEDEQAENAYNDKNDGRKNIDE